MTTTTGKKRNPNDATFRNINALKKRVAAIEKLLRDVFGHVRFNHAVRASARKRRSGRG